MKTPTREELLEVVRWYARRHFITREPVPDCPRCDGKGEYEEENRHNGDTFTSTCGCTTDPVGKQNRSDYQCDDGARARKVLGWKA